MAMQNDSHDMPVRDFVVETMEESRLKSCVQAVIRKRADGDNKDLPNLNYFLIKETFKPVLTFATFLGLIPLKTLYACQCSVVLYTYPAIIIIVITTCFLLLFFNHGSCHNLNDCKLEDIASLLIIFGSTFHGILSVITSTITYSRIYEFFNSLEVIAPLIGSKENHKQLKRRSIAIMIALTAINFILNFQVTVQEWIKSGHFNQKQFLEGVFMFYLYFLIFTPISYLLFSTCLFKDGFAILDETLQNVLREDPLDSFALLQIRLLHNYFCTLIEKMNNTISLKLFAFFFGGVGELSISIYLLIYINETQRIFWSLKCFLLYSWIVSVCIAAESISTQAKLSLKTLCKISGWKLSSDVVFQIHLFMSNMTCLPLDITASGYFVVKRHLLTTLTSVIVSYVIVLVQFRIDHN